MRTHILLLAMGVALSGCLEPIEQSDGEAASPKEPSPIIDNLPVSDRDLLLAPLESALDDLRKGIDNNPGYFASERPIAVEGFEGVLAFKLDGPDTVMLSMVLTNTDGASEQNAYYFDKSGRLFYSEHSAENYFTAPAVESSTYALKMYHDDGGSLLSSYARWSADAEEVEDWTPVCLTAAQERFWLSRRRLVSGG